MRKKWRLWVILAMGVLMLVGGGLVVASPVKDQIVIWKHEYDTNQRMNRPQTVIVTRVIDGDTIEIAGGERVRYIGIDAPENKSYSTSELERIKTGGSRDEIRKVLWAFLYKESVTQNTELVLNKKVKLLGDIEDKDIYGRLLRYVYIDDIFVNAELVRLGLAYPVSYPPNTKYADYFRQMTLVAKSNKSGAYKDPWEAIINWHLFGIPIPGLTPTPGPSWSEEQKLPFTYIQQAVMYDLMAKKADALANEISGRRFSTGEEAAKANLEAANYRSLAAQYRDIAAEYRRKAYKP